MKLNKKIVAFTLMFNLGYTSLLAKPTVAYHSDGEVMYWWWHQTGKLYDDTYRIAKEWCNNT